jgi:hypothetical protein
MALNAEQRGQLRRDIERSERLRAEMREKIEAGQDIDLVNAWEVLEQLDLEIGKRIRMLQPK